MWLYNYSVNKLNADDLYFKMLRDGFVLLAKSFQLCAKC